VRFMSTNTSGCETPREPRRHPRVADPVAGGGARHGCAAHGRLWNAMWFSAEVTAWVGNQLVFIFGWVWDLS
jgi:hypothetical protein